MWESFGLQADLDGNGRLDDGIDADADGVFDNIVVNALSDTDGDGISNHYDLDSDGDGAWDLAEAGGDDLNDDGQIDAWTDSDGDGVVDAVDVDVTGGDDVDGDGIDDFADADFIFADDTDGDGVIDLFDADFLGDGYLPLTVDGQRLAPGELRDADGNGIADVFEANDIVDVFEPNTPAAALPEGQIHTGLAGRGGCSIGIGGGTPDPLLPLLAILAAGTLMYRGRNARRPRH